MPTSMTSDWLIGSLVLHNMWSINELEDNEINVGLIVRCFNEDILTIFK
jgi:hypothetical protein